jgi:hypothetical protein
MQNTFNAQMVMLYWHVTKYQSPSAPNSLWDMVKVLVRFELIDVPGMRTTGNVAAINVAP